MLYINGFVLTSSTKYWKAFINFFYFIKYFIYYLFILFYQIFFILSNILFSIFLFYQISNWFSNLWPPPLLYFNCECNGLLQTSSDNSDDEDEEASQSVRERVIARIKRRKEANEKKRDIDVLRAPVVSCFFFFFLRDFIFKKTLFKKTSILA